MWVNHCSHNMPCSKAPQKQSAIISLPFSLPNPTQKQHPEPNVGALASGQAGGQAPFWSRSEAAPLFKKTEVTKSVSQKISFQKGRQKLICISLERTPSYSRRPKMHKRQRSPSRKTPFSMFFSSMAGGMWNAALKTHLQTRSSRPQVLFPLLLTSKL